MINNKYENIFQKTNSDQNITNGLYSHAKTMIPGGTQLLSKRPEMFAPNQWPAYFSKAKGCEVWDLDNKHYYDFSCSAIASCILGFADPDVTDAVSKRISDGSMCTLNPPEEVELAQMLCDIHPWASQVRFARCGGEAMAIAARIARATTKKTVVAVCGYHGWHDWYLAANLTDQDSLSKHLIPGLSADGVPSELKGTNVIFHYNNSVELVKIIAEYGNNLAAVVMEPTRYNEPEPGFLENVKEKTRQIGALLVFDEISIGWRLCFGGAHLHYGIEPDIAVFAKAISNGYPMAAIIGTSKAMSGAHESFISSTYWTESVGPVAALATLKKMKQVNAHEYINKIGKLVIKHWLEIAKKHNLNISVCQTRPCLTGFSFNYKNANELKTLFVQEMLKKGFLATTRFYSMLSHTENEVELYAKAVDETFAEISAAIETNDVAKKLKGPTAHTGFARLT